MTAYDFSSTRLFVDAPMSEGAQIDFDDGQANYLRNVLRMGEGDGLLLFNGRDGEWSARLVEVAKKRARAELVGLTRPQTPSGRLRWLFAPLKHARLDYMVQKAVEMGVSRISPAITRRTQVSRVNLDRMRANAVEAAEQCGVLAVPEINEPETLEAILARWPEGEPLVFCDEDAAGADPLAPLRALAGKPLALLIGPEGGFDPAERKALSALPQTVRIGLGPRILRADTAAVAALAVLQATVGDWSSGR
ncbi:16S rRNA (uracil(1498)-N(3))-methyltransferase [Chenggangzhangella methanolivorans]|uniref:Ribosomal RNA small subunit methyltransferase E n=1 Tax=Chenggangzhangella methanolivorans TaxID=1437009 RepID=A0A9E6ULB8_9HYPH|nr:16S rRNA (uracil(1498)-N(3))-methyltransferase [Chenggangzhangella methanolivorans]QZN98755.1 16S rRNA (uracil(1498)-N(3))-methyltransferase [Chenggangzhangella methanolivorans]